MTAGASSPPCSCVAAVRTFVDSASPGRNEVDSLSCAFSNFVGMPAAVESTTTASQAIATTHLAIGLATNANRRLTPRSSGRELRLSTELVDEVRVRELREAGVRRDGLQRGRGARRVVDPG